jgi:hypothetical protein
VWRARFAGALHRFLRFATGLFVALAFALSLPAQEGPKKERVRFVDGRAELCEVVSADAGGATLRLDALPRPVRFPWWQLDPGDADALRARLLGKPAAPAAGESTVAGVRIRTLDQRTIEGVLVPGSPEGELWVKNAEGRFVVRADEVASREEAAFPVRRIYLGEELVQVLLGRIRPGSPEDYDRLGGELLRASLRERALAAFRTAELLRHPERPESVLYRELIRLRDRVDDLAARQAVFQAQERWSSGDWDGALLQVDAVEKLLEARPDAPVLAETRRLRAQLQAFRGRARDERIVDEWRRSAEALLKAKAVDRALGWAEARAYAEDGLERDVLERVRARFNFSPEDPAAKLAWDRRPEEDLEKHSYEESSWIVGRPDAGSPEAWWKGASDAARYALLKGLYVEKRLEVRHAGSKSCGGCGGAGVRDGALCPVCAGLRSQRVLFYR